MKNLFFCFLILVFTPNIFAAEEKIAENKPIVIDQGTGEIKKEPVETGSAEAPAVSQKTEAPKNDEKKEAGSKKTKSKSQSRAPASFYFYPSNAASAPAQTGNFAAPQETTETGVAFARMDPVAPNIPQGPPVPVPGIPEGVDYEKWLEESIVSKARLEEEREMTRSEIAANEALLEEEFMESDAGLPLSPAEEKY